VSLTSHTRPSQEVSTEEGSPVGVPEIVNAFDSVPFELRVSLAVEITNV